MKVLLLSRFNRQLNQMAFKGNFGYDVMESILYGTWLMLFIFKLTHNWEWSEEEQLVGCSQENLSLFANTFFFWIVKYALLVFSCTLQRKLFPLRVGPFSRNGCNISRKPFMLSFDVPDETRKTFSICFKQYLPWDWLYWLNDTRNFIGLFCNAKFYYQC